MYDFYVDVYVAQNFFLLVIVLSACFLLQKRNGRTCIACIPAASLCGSFGELVLLLLSPNLLCAKILIFLFLYPLLLCLTFKIKRIRDLGLYNVFSLFVETTMGGLAQAAFNLFHWKEISFFCIVAFGMIVLLFVFKGTQVRSIQKKIVPVTLGLDGVSIQTLGFYDSGNCLREPFQGRGVHIISPELAGRLHLEKTYDRARRIPYRSLGASGLLTIYLIEEIRIEEIGKKRKIIPAVVGVASEELMKNKDYQIILNQEVLEG